MTSDSEVELILKRVRDLAVATEGYPDEEDDVSDAKQLTLDGAEEPMRTKQANYARGADFERRLAGLLRDDGYFAGRFAGSHGIADVVALKHGEQPVIVQCKITGSITHEDWNTLLAVARSLGARPVLASRSANGHKVFARELADFHAARSTFWPTLPWKEW